MSDDMPYLAPPGPDDTFDLFTLHGGPNDGITLVVTQCEHEAWPDLVPEGMTVGAYVFRTDPERYAWDERRAHHRHE